MFILRMFILISVYINSVYFKIKYVYNVLILIIKFRNMIIDFLLWFLKMVEKVIIFVNW